MTECNTTTRLHLKSQSRVDIDFNATDITTDGGFVLMRQIDDRLKLCELVAGFVPDDRRQTHVVHSRKEQVRQRAFQILHGYEDASDAAWLRTDPLLKVACGADAEGAHLSSQPTLSRLENAPEAHHVEAMRLKLLRDWIDRLDDDRTEIVLDLDASAFEGHGAQEELNFSGYHDGHILHPIFVYDDHDGQLVTAIMRPGRCGDAHGCADLMRDLVVLLKAFHRRDCAIIFRADGGFAGPALYRQIEKLCAGFGQVYYLFGLSRNSVVERLLEPALEQVRSQRRRGQTLRNFVDFDYRAGSWKRDRHIVGKAEVGPLGDNPRFVVTSLSQFSARLLYERYCERGRCEQHIEALKCHLRADRIGCHSFEANAFRLVLGTVAYRLMHELRATIQRIAPNVDDAPQVKKKLKWLAKASFETLRLRLLKVAMLVRKTARRLHLQGAASFPLAREYGYVARALG